ncbi:hypothetical protein UFOVP84_188 [uncultured Caudovirales phage]|uniref:Uncharacterized protein n=1 Tax=uncultured Caudovirales phage TaxID=2100421 RepID=A0A6J5L4E3_9CAUD|nr:hypothetical protein UFOVP84_188 [uncultured Caudovirales phage]
MSKERELLKKAIQIIETLGPDEEAYEFINEILLLEPEQEPVAWVFPSDLKRFETQETTAVIYSGEMGKLSKNSIPLYTHPPKREPVTNEPTTTAMAVMPNGVCVSNVYDAYEEGRKSVMSEQEPEFGDGPEFDGWEKRSGNSFMQEPTLSELDRELLKQACKTLNNASSYLKDKNVNLGINMNEIKLDITKLGIIQNVLSKISNGDAFVLREDNTTGIGSILYIDIPIKLNGIEGTFTTTISGVETW